MRRSCISARLIGLAALVGFFAPMSAAVAQGTAPPTPEQERYSRARERAQLEIAALKAKANVAEAELGQLAAEHELGEIKGRALAIGYPELAITLAVEPDPIDPVSGAILDALDRRVSMPFAQETPLEDIIKYIKSVTAESALPDGIPIYLDPLGLQQADKTESSPVAINLEGVALGRSLKLLLKQLGLTYTVKDGLLTITAEGRAIDSVDEAWPRRRRASTAADPTAEALDRVVAFDFARPTTLVDALEQIRKSTVGGRLPMGLPFVVTPRAAALVAGAKVALKAEGSPLKESLTRALGPLGMGYTTRGGMVVIDRFDAEASGLKPAAPAGVAPNPPADNGGVRPEPEPEPDPKPPADNGGVRPEPDPKP